jgi:hypothetical protein
MRILSFDKTRAISSELFQSLLVYDTIMCHVSSRSHALRFEEQNNKLSFTSHHLLLQLFVARSRTDEFASN